MRKIFLTLTPFLSLLVCSFAQTNSNKYFIHHTIADPLPGMEDLGTGGFSLADFDNDGDLDVTISRNSDSGFVYWYENKNGRWQNHLLGTSDAMQLGTVSLDIGNDGNADLVMGRFWFKNPGNLKDEPDAKWEKNFYAGALESENHDIVTADINMDGSIDVLSYSQTSGNGVLRWYDVTNEMQWVPHTISDKVNELVKHIPGSNGIHGGFAPKGVADLSGDQFPDIVTPTGWYKNPGKNTDGAWEFQRWPFHTGIIPNLYGLSFRSWVTDLDGDGDNDVIYTDCDVAYSKGYWLENKGNAVFLRNELPPLPDSTGSFHSLAVADFDRDGDLDIVSGEQEHSEPGMKPVGLKERGFIWINVGTPHKPLFTDVVIFHIDNPGWHEAQTGDVDGDGDVDIVSKIWSKDGPNYHVDYWENIIGNK
jgi:hypothetical protein